MSELAIDSYGFSYYMSLMAGYRHPDGTCWEGVYGHCVNYDKNGYPVAIMRVKNLLNAEAAL